MAYIVMAWDRWISLGSIVVVIIVPAWSDMPGLRCAVVVHGLFFVWQVCEGERQCLLRNNAWLAWAYVVMAVSDGMGLYSYGCVRSDGPI